MDTKFKFSSGNLLSILSSVVFACFLLYVFEIYNEESVSKGMFANEKENIINELKRTRSSLEISVAENTLLQSELIVQKQKAANLLDEINFTNVDISKIYELKKEVTRFTAFVGRLNTENRLLRTEKANLKRQRDSLQSVINSVSKGDDTLVMRKNSPHYLFQNEEKIRVVNFKTTPVKQDKSGYFERTYSSNSVNRLKVSFMVVWK